MPVRSIKNQYLGINAHLHSYWQAKGRWNMFHHVHISDLARLVRQTLIPMGYTASPERSIQIRRLTDSPRQYKTYHAVGIYRPGITTPIAWLEILAPKTKAPTTEIEKRDSRAYTAQHVLLMKREVIYIELDYLHETPSILPIHWSERPYGIIVFDPRPDLMNGRATIHEFDVDQLVPTVNILLHGQDTFTFDFNAAYTKTYEEMLFGIESVDYSQLPLHFERYTAADQTRIARRMVAVLEAARAGTDLESGPFPVRDVLLNEALAQIESFRAGASD